MHSLTKKSSLFNLTMNETTIHFLSERKQTKRRVSIYNNFMKKEKKKIRVR